LYLYQERQQELYYLHPMSPTLLTIVLVVLAFMLSQPLLLLGLLLAVYLDLIAAGLGSQAQSYLKIGLTMSGLVIIINLLFNHHGETVIAGLTLWNGVRLNFTLEVLIFAVAMSLRLLIVLEAFCFFTYLVNPDQIIKHLSRWGGNTALALAITLRLLPSLTQKATVIREIQSCRGVEWEGSGIRKKLKHSLPLLLSLLGDSLEDSMQMAQSLQTRGFGVGKRVVYNSVYWTYKDSMFITVIMAGFCLGLVLTITGQGGFAFYPLLGPIISPAMLYASGGLFLLFSYPVIWSEGWRLWRSWKLIA